MPDPKRGPLLPLTSRWVERDDAGLEDPYMRSWQLVLGGELRPLFVLTSFTGGTGGTPDHWQLSVSGVYRRPRDDESEMALADFGADDFAEQARASRNPHARHFHWPAASVFVGHPCDCPHRRHGHHFMGCPNA